MSLPSKKFKDKEYLAPCPCLQRDGSNYLCLNLDSIRDVVFFDLLCCEENVKPSPDNPMCVNLLYVENDLLYCASTCQPLTIRKCHVLADMYREALDTILVWLPQNQPPSSSDICAPCLYKTISTQIEKKL